MAIAYLEGLVEIQPGHDVLIGDATISYEAFTGPGWTEAERNEFGVFTIQETELEPGQSYTGLKVKDGLIVRSVE